MERIQVEIRQSVPGWKFAIGDDWDSRVFESYEAADRAANEALDKRLSFHAVAYAIAPIHRYRPV